MNKKYLLAGNVMGLSCSLTMLIMLGILFFNASRPEFKVLISLNPLEALLAISVLLFAFFVFLIISTVILVVEKTEEELKRKPKKKRRVKVGNLPEPTRLQTDSNSADFFSVSSIGN